MAIFAMLLSVRLLSPVGYMPGNAAGQVAILICDHAGQAPSQHKTGHHQPASHDHGGKSEAAKHQCPFASVAPLAGGKDDLPVTGPLIAFADLPPAGLRHFLIERFRRDERPPSHAPPSFA